MKEAPKPAPQDAKPMDKKEKARLFMEKNKGKSFHKQLSRRKEGQQENSHSGKSGYSPHFDSA